MMMPTTFLLGTIVAIVAQLVPEGLNIPFFRYRWPFFIWSGLLLVATIIVVSINGMNFGIDFKGGTVIEVQMPGPADLSAMRTTIDALGLGASELQTAGSERDVLIRMEASQDQNEQRAASSR